MKTFKQFFTESAKGGLHISVDVQAEYEHLIPFDIPEYFEWMIQNHERVICYFNGPELGMVEESEHVYWLIEQGVSEENIDRIDFQEKGYAFFRACMDEDYQDCLVDTIKFMFKYDITDSRDISTEQWDALMGDVDDCEEIRDFLSQDADMINIPDLMYQLNDLKPQYSNVSVSGGGDNECLEEIRLALHALDMPFSESPEWTY